MELLSVENIDYDTNFIECLFDGILKEGFYITTDFDFDKEQVDYKDDDTGSYDYFEAVNISFWDFKTFNSENELIGINERELKKIKELVEFKLTDLLEIYLNEN
tara:strand:+ start:527 stop:838 length:312 start_codon:yes stop_codon:yes gene_type:complete